MSTTQTHLDLEASSTKSVRSETLDPDLINSDYASKWAFQLPACFRDALDIVWDVRAENRVRRNTWTQGTNYRFAAGDVIYDSPKAYLPWSEALAHITTALKVLNATPAGVDFDGKITFSVSHPEEGKALVTKGTYECTQVEFVTLLRTGRFNSIPHALL